MRGPAQLALGLRQQVFPLLFGVVLQGIGCFDQRGHIDFQALNFARCDDRYLNRQGGVVLEQGRRWQRQASPAKGGGQGVFPGLLLAFVVFFPDGLPLGLNRSHLFGQTFGLEWSFVKKFQGRAFQVGTFVQRGFVMAQGALRVSQAFIGQQHVRDAAGFTVLHDQAATKKHHPHSRVGEEPDRIAPHRQFYKRFDLAGEGPHPEARQPALKLGVVGVHAREPIAFVAGEFNIGLLVRAGRVVIPPVKILGVTGEAVTEPGFVIGTGKTDTPRRVFGARAETGRRRVVVNVQDQGGWRFDLGQFGRDTLTHQLAGVNALSQRVCRKARTAKGVLPAQAYPLKGLGLAHDGTVRTIPPPAPSKGDDPFLYGTEFKVHEQMTHRVVPGGADIADHQHLHTRLGHAGVQRSRPQRRGGCLPQLGFGQEVARRQQIKSAQGGYPQAVSFAARRHPPQNAKLGGLDYHDSASAGL